MQCPTDGSTLVMSERSGIEIDYCPQCRGVWLDRGELDKIIDRAGDDRPQAAPQQPAPQVAPQQQPYPTQAQHPYPPQGQQPYPPQQQSGNPLDLLRQMTGGGDRRYDDRRHDDGYGRNGYTQNGYDQGHYRKKKKDNWLSDLFD
ncbi:zf-TFIIB domain-containing protein [Agromyces sp. LHK192]|uniref:TFIIB-type zinc ribbon-containing protein n=1 Tax=Agromyces sp. LHK192 TaxID=2498704 RepID=UPI000FD94457|nr:zf-TFIIB domain-containing protein [Agromyces sp. LHK192]